MTNPFTAEADFLVLVNDEGQHSLWPALREPPSGWVVALSSRTRQECLDWIESHWTDMRPLSLVRREAASTS